MTSSKFFSAAILMACGLAVTFPGCTDEEDESLSPTPKQDTGVASDDGVDTNAPPSDDGTDAPPVVVTDKDVTDDITADTTWTASNRYHLKKFVRVKAPATLTIEAGVTIASGPGAEVFGLAILPGAKIKAMGTAAKPIVFTSGAKKGSRKPGDWAGLMILGKAKTNLPAPRYPEGLKDNPDYAYGGDDDADSSGELHYVRVEYAGYQLSANNEINAFSFFGVGSGTKLDHLQAHFGNDDSFEFFGGTVDAKYLIATSGTDDCFDMDNGFRGRLQFLICNRDDISGGGNGFETDNDSSGSTATPQTNPTVWNATIVGKTTTTTEGGHGMHLRRNVAGKYNNILVANWPLSGVFVDGTAALANATAGSLDVRNSLFANAKNYNDMAAGGAIELWATGTGKDNKTAANLAAVMISDTSSDKYNFALKDGSPALTGAGTPPTEFFDASGKDFIGACGKTCTEFEGWTTKEAP
jgi:hypothetical protein